MSTIEQKPLWTLEDAQNGKHYPVWEELSKHDARKFLQLVDKLYELKNKPKPSLQELRLGHQGTLQLLRINRDILARCLRLTTEDLRNIPDNQVNSLLGQFAMIAAAET